MKENFRIELDWGIIMSLDNPCWLLCIFWAVSCMESARENTIAQLVDWQKNILKCMVWEN